MKLTKQRLCIDLGQEWIRIGSTKDGVLLSERNEKLYVPSSVILKPKVKREQAHVLSEFQDTYKAGQIQDREGLAGYLRTLLISLERKPLPILGGTVLLAVPATSTQVHKETLLEIFTELGFSKVVFCPAPLASAVGAGFSLPLKHAVLVVHLGSSNGEIALLSFSSTKSSTRTTLSGIGLEEHLLYSLYTSFHLKAGRKEIRKLLQLLGTSLFTPESILNKSLGDIPGLSKRFEQIPFSFIQTHVQEFLESLYAEIGLFLQDLSSAQLSSIADHGILLSGGLGGMPGLSEECAKQLQLPVFSLPGSSDLVIQGQLKLLDSCD